MKKSTLSLSTLTLSRASLRPLTTGGLFQVAGGSPFTTNTKNTLLTEAAQQTCSPPQPVSK